MIHASDLLDAKKYTPRAKAAGKRKSEEAEGRWPPKTASAPPEKPWDWSIPSMIVRSRSRSYDVLLPCRMFLIDHKVAVLGRTSLTTEFLLRLVKAVPGISRKMPPAFFGFNLRETSFVLAEAEAPGLH